MIRCCRLHLDANFCKRNCFRTAEPYLFLFYGGVTLGLHHLKLCLLLSQLRLSLGELSVSHSETAFLNCQISLK